MRTIFIITLVGALSLVNHSKANDLSPRAAAIAYVTQEVPICDTPKTLGPALGVGFSTIGIFAGSLMLMGPVASNSTGGAFGTSDDLSAGQKGVMAAGGILAAASIAGLVVSGIYLHRARKAKLSTCQLTYINRKANP